jgi:hypothetical protein
MPLNIVCIDDVQMALSHVGARLSENAEPVESQEAVSPSKAEKAITDHMATRDPASSCKRGANQSVATAQSHMAE